MLFMDMPNVPPQYIPVIVAQASQITKQNAKRTIGVCHPIENKLESKSSAVNSLSPIGATYGYFLNMEGEKFDWSVVEAGQLSLVEAPAHGTLSSYSATGSFSYISNDYEYAGTDRAVFLVEMGDYKIKIIYDFVLMQSVPGSGAQGDATDNKRICPNGRMWKISSTLDTNGNSTLNSVEYQPSTVTTSASVTDIATLVTTLEANLLSDFPLDTSSVTVTFADLPGAAVGQTVGNTGGISDETTSHLTNPAKDAE